MLQFKLKQPSSRHTSCIHKGLHAGKWLDLMTSKTDSVSTLGYHWAHYTGTTLAAAIIQWSSSGNPENSHKYTGVRLVGITLADASIQWCPSGDPLFICIIGTHWKTTGRSLKDHWKHTGNKLATNNPFSSGILMYTWVLIPSTLDCHWITTEFPLAQGRRSDTCWFQLKFYVP